MGNLYKRQLSKNNYCHLFCIIELIIINCQLNGDIKVHVHLRPPDSIILSINVSECYEFDWNRNEYFHKLTTKWQSNKRKVEMWTFQQYIPIQLLKISMNMSTWAVRWSIVFDVWKKFQFHVSKMFCRIQ